MKKILFFVIFPILVLFFLLHYWLVGIAVYGDARYYWYFARSIIIDHDLNLDNEANHRYDYLGDNVYKFQNEQPITPKGNPKDEFHQPIGTSIAWLPFLFTADFLAKTLVFFHVPILANGYSDIYQITVGIGAIFLVTFGLWLTYKLIRNFFSPKVSAIAIISMLFATNLFYYSSLDVINSHAISFFFSSVFFYIWFKSLKKRSNPIWFVLGLLIGFLAEIRTQDGIFASIVIAEIFWNGIVLFKQKKKLTDFVKKSLIRLLIFSIGFIIAMTPQFLVWKIIYGGFLSVPYLAHSDPFSIFTPHFLGVLINMKTGIIPYSPIIIPAVFGLYLFWKKEKKLSFISLLFFALEYYIISSWGAWDQAASYGIRMLLSTMPILILGCAVLIEKLVKMWSQKIVISFCVILIMFNFLMIGVFHLFLKEVTYDGGKPTNVRALEKINKTFHLHLNFFK